MILEYGIFMGWRMIGGRLIFLRHGVVRLLLRDLFLKMMSNIFLRTIRNIYGNVCFFLMLVLTIDCVAVGSALVSHFSYYWQSQVEILTDVLDRYKALVIDRVDGDLILYDY